MRQLVEQLLGFLLYGNTTAFPDVSPFKQRLIMGFPILVGFSLRKLWHQPLSHLTGSWAHLLSILLSKCRGHSIEHLLSSDSLTGGLLRLTVRLTFLVRPSTTKYLRHVVVPVVSNRLVWNTAIRSPLSDLGPPSRWNMAQTKWGSSITNSPAPRKGQYRSSKSSGNYFHQSGWFRKIALGPGLHKHLWSRAFDCTLTFIPIPPEVGSSL